MKKMIVFLGMTMVFLAGCTAHGPSVSVDPGGIYSHRYDGGGHHRGGGSGRFCPPGQAKKGNC